jgi:hypothetical protein
MKAFNLLLRLPSVEGPGRGVGIERQTTMGNRLRGLRKAGVEIVGGNQPNRDGADMSIVLVVGPRPKV